MRYCLIISQNVTAPKPSDWLFSQNVTAPKHNSNNKALTDETLIEFINDARNVEYTIYILDKSGKIKKIK